MIDMARYEVNLLALVAGIGFALLFAALWRRRRSIDCMDLITSPDGKLSRTAIGQSFGILVAVWAPIYTTLQGKLDGTVFATSLAYLGLVEGYAKYLRYKNDQAKGVFDSESTMVRKP